ncbi:hypothetical protein M5D96_003667 [Drosophila gunungcola]|uniref:Uncharacterized protein n=1 Tax=Drosophila gunungcola TaxID=103775 RepID=A0A9P9YSI7_9MUSC|nr:hypothetical protein M5D96_003667 [Drosophila gunungcola]
MEQIERWMIESFMVLRPGTLISNLWESPSMDITVDFDPTVKPRFTEHGPYRFTERMQKLNVEWHDANSTVSYMRRSRFEFDPIHSAGRPSDPIVAPNLLIKMLSWSPMLRSLMMMALSIYGKERTMVRPASDWMFDGFDTPLIKMSKFVPPNLVPEMNFPYEKIGYAYPKLGQIARWRYNNVTEASPRCKLKGSTGEFHPIPLVKGRPISFFLPDLCRELQIDYSGSTTFEGVEAYVYRGSERNVANENCQEVRSGLLNISSCWYGTPVFASYPHFYKADPYYVEQVEGMKPEKDRHEMVIMLEPKTGMLLEIKARIMANLLVEPRTQSIYRKARTTFFPLIWADYNVRITDDLLSYVKLIPIMELLGKIGGILGVAVGVVMIFWYPHQMIWQKRFMQKIEITPDNRQNIDPSTTIPPNIKMTSRVRHCAHLGIVVIGIFCIVSGIYLFRNWIDMFTRMRGKILMFTSSTGRIRRISMWDQGKKPRFEQLGPYRFREHPDKVDINWHNHNYSVSFNKKSWFYFDVAGSNGSLSDIVTQVNSVAHAAARRAADSWLGRAAVNFANNVYGQKLTVTKTVDEMLFKGYEHPFIKVGKLVSPQDVPYARYPRNGSANFDGDINMFTGADDIAKMGQIHTWNNMTHTGAFEGTCGQVHGSMGEFFPPNLSTNGSVYMYMPKMCRAIPLDYTETCMPVGVINIGPCAFNASVYMSYPHFYLADPSFLEAIDGLQPEREKHEFFMTLEPNAGVPMDVGGGFQANYYMEPIPDITIYENIPRVMIPMMWAEERVRVTEEIAADVALVPLIVLLGQIVTGILLAGGLICTCWYPARQVTHFCHSDPKAKASVLRPLTVFGVNSAAATAPVAQLFRNNTSSSGNNRVGVRLLEYNRSSGIKDESGTTERSARERLISEDSPDVVVR